MPRAHDGRGARLIPTDVAGAVIGRRDDVLDREDRLQELEEPCDAHAGSRAREIWGR